MLAKKLVLLSVVVVLLLSSVACRPNDVNCFLELPATVTCILAYESENDDTENRFDLRAGGDFYSMPPAGGQAILLMGGYLDFPPCLQGTPFASAIIQFLQDFPIINQALDMLRYWGIDIRLRELVHVKVSIWDREDPSNVLYEFDGDIVEFLSQPDIEVVFGGWRAVLVKKVLDVPAGNTWWQGKMEVTASNSWEGHDDTALIMGGINAWVDAHNGRW